MKMNLNRWRHLLEDLVIKGGNNKWFLMKRVVKVCG